MVPTIAWGGPLFQFAMDNCQFSCWGGRETFSYPTSRWLRSIIRVIGISGLHVGRFFTTESQRAQSGRAANQIRATARNMLARFRCSLELCQEDKLLRPCNKERKVFFSWPYRANAAHHGTGGPCTKKSLVPVFPPLPLWLGGEKYVARSVSGSGRETRPQRGLRADRSNATVRPIFNLHFSILNLQFPVYGSAGRQTTVESYRISYQTTCGV